MVLLIAGSTHTGKTLLAQRVLEERGWPYLSLDHLKMGLIRSGLTSLTPDSPDKELTALLWPVAREMIKTAIENGQNLVVEGCYIPCDFTKDFVPYYLDQLRAIWLIFSRRYIWERFDQILACGGAIERRLDPSLDREALERENEENLRANCYRRISDSITCTITNERQQPKSSGTTASSLTATNARKPGRTEPKYPGVAHGNDASIKSEYAATPGCPPQEYDDHRRITTAEIRHNGPPTGNTD